MNSTFYFLPKDLRALLKYISPAAFAVVDWKDALKKSQIISRELVFKKHYDQKVSKIQKIVSPDFVTFAQLTPKQTKSNNPRLSGECLLYLYFSQIILGDSVFLDLRAKHFRYKDDGALIWQPSSLYCNFSPGFLTELANLYIGFFDGSDELFKLSLFKMGLLPDSLVASDKAKLIELLYKHFGTSRHLAVDMKIASFVKSFDELFDFLRDKRVRVSSDFLFLGVYLLTIYLHLDNLGAAYDVKSTFVGARKNYAEP